MKDFPKIPPEAPKSWRILAARVIAVGVILGATSYGAAQIPGLKNNVAAACRSIHACGPLPPTDVQPFQSGWLPSGSTFNSAVAPTLTTLRQANPDWEVQFIEGNEYSRKDFWGKPTYRFEGRFQLTPKWQGLI